MGLLLAKVGGAWVPVTPAGTVTPPAYAGPLPTDLTIARFGNLAGDQKHGFSVTGDGYTDAIFGANKSWAFWDTAPFGQPGARFVGKFYYANGYGALDIGPWTLGTHPTHANAALWHTGSAANDYTLRKVGPSTYFNGESRVSLCVANVEKLYSTGPTVQSAVGIHAPNAHIWSNTGDAGFAVVCDNAGLRTGASFETTRIGGSWTQAGFLNNQGGPQGSIALHSPGVAPQMRARNDRGERFDFVNNPNSNWIPIAANAFEVSSTITLKRDVKVLRERERIIVRHPVESDTVPEIDIMGLKPVTFRPKIPMLKIVPTDPSGMYSTIKTNDDSTWTNEPWPMDTVFGREGTRERLGLVAEDVETVIPSAVSHDIDGNAMGIDYAQVTVALLDHVQRLTEEMATLRYRIAELEGAQP